MEISFDFFTSLVKIDSMYIKNIILVYKFINL